MLEEHQLILLNAMILDIYEEPDEIRMRTNLISQLHKLVDFDSATFYRRLGPDSLKMGKQVLFNTGEFLKQEVFEEGIREYMARYEDYDYGKYIMYSGKNLVYRETDIISEEERVKTDYYHMINGKCHWHFSMSANISYQKNFLGVLTLFRDKSKPDFTKEDMFRVELLCDHLALRMSRDFYEESSQKMQINDCIKSCGLTQKEGEVLKMILEGSTNDQMCQKFSISLNTLKKHLLGIYKKTGYNSKLQVVQHIRLEK